MSAVQILMNSKDLVQSEGIDEFIINCKVGNATRSKLRRVSEWIVHTKRTHAENHQQVISKNWKERMKNDSADFFSISELLPQSKPCNLNISASISKIVLMGSLGPETKGQLSVIEKHTLNGHNDIIRDFIAAGCKLCGLPLYQKYANACHLVNISSVICPKIYIALLVMIYKNLYAEIFMETVLIQLIAQIIQSISMLLARYINHSW
uniref:Uncharacterized protein n=1 Tax=Aegilops tauschii subsp. strangulata TaxID=200361 RepID=A0A453C398_AEGTS